MLSAVLRHAPRAGAAPGVRPLPLPRGGTRDPFLTSTAGRSFASGAAVPGPPEPKNYPQVHGVVASMEAYDPHPRCYTSLDPASPGQACSDQGGGNEGIPREYIAIFTQQQTKREPEVLGVSTYSGLIWALLAGWYFIYGWFQITSSYHDTFWQRIFLFGAFD